MKSILKIPINPIANLNEELKKMTPLSIALGHDNDVFVLLMKEQIPLIDGRFPATVTEKSYRYQVIHLKDGQKKVLNLRKEKWNYHYIQPIDDGQFLLVCSRSYYHDAQNIEKNARVYDENGRFIRSFCLGDGIGHVYVTKNQKIWTGYFVEGVFGNYGWEVPIGRSGLVGWDASGSKLDSLEEDKEYYIFECLALNGLDDGGIWFFFSLDSKIGVRNGESIILDECIKDRTTNNIAERNITANPPYFKFYKVDIIIEFNKKGLFTKSKNIKDFLYMQNKLNDLGYSTFDLS